MKGWEEKERKGKGREGERVNSIYSCLYERYAMLYNINTSHEEEEEEKKKKKQKKKKNIKERKETPPAKRTSSVRI